MPLPFLAIAIPVMHSSGAWIASTAASGYIAGTFSGTWIGTFILGNSTLLSSLGLVSAAGVFGAAGGIAALGSSAALGLGTALSAVGLGGVASALGIAPIATFLGLTPVGWAIAGTAVTVASTLGYYFTHKTMKQLNEEREKGGLDPTTLIEIVKDVRAFETASLKAVIAKLDRERTDVSLLADGESVLIGNQNYSILRLRYRVNKNGSEEIIFVTKLGRRIQVLLVKPPSSPDGKKT